MVRVMLIMEFHLTEKDMFYLGFSRPNTGLHGGSQMCTFEASWEKARCKAREAWLSNGYQNKSSSGMVYQL